MAYWSDGILPCRVPHPMASIVLDHSSNWELNYLHRRIEDCLRTNCLGINRPNHLLMTQQRIERLLDRRNSRMSVTRIESHARVRPPVRVERHVQVTQRPVRVEQHVQVEEQVHTRPAVRTEERVQVEETVRTRPPARARPPVRVQEHVETGPGFRRETIRITSSSTGGHLESSSDEDW